jgi:hypothetical protein
MMDSMSAKLGAAHKIHNIPEAWETEDSRRGYDEYIALCRDAHRAGAPLPPMFRTQREAAP